MSAHIAPGVLTTAGICLLACAMSSGRSYLTLKSSNMAKLTAYPYGVGVTADSNGYTWVDREHLLSTLGCDDHIHRGQYVMAASYMVMISAGLAVLAHSIGAQSGSKITGLVGAGLHGFNLVILVTALGVGANAYDSGFWCDPSKVGRKVFLKEFFDLNFAVPFLIVFILTSLISLASLVAGGALKDKEEAPKETEPVDEA